MEIVNYKIQDEILTIVFEGNDIKCNNFVVSTQILYDSTVTKQQLIYSAEVL